jgi:poly(3-hydroxybutyrate) depolymerase
MDKRKHIHLLRIIFIIVIFIALCYGALRVRIKPQLTYDAAYWPTKTIRSGFWQLSHTPAGITYNLYINPEIEKDDASKSQIPLIVCFHGSSGKGTSKERFGRPFTDPDIQKKINSAGIAVLVPQSRLEYFSDPQAYIRLIENILLQYPAIDPNRVAIYGFSQGAAFVHELAIKNPSLFRVAVTGSSYYSASPAELFCAARVHFYGALSKNDTGIYEQGVKTAHILGILCPNSRYVEYENRGHFFVETDDKTGHGEETFINWLTKALSK